MKTGVRRVRQAATASAGTRTANTIQIRRCRRRSRAIMGQTDLALLVFDAHAGELPVGVALLFRFTATANRAGQQPRPKRNESR